MKRRIVAAGLLLFALWPPVHFALVRRYDVDPWKLFGFAMYSVPGAMRTVRIVGIEADGTLRLLDFRAYPPELERRVTAWRTRRSGLGRLASGAPLARALLSERPQWDGVVIAVIDLALDRESARLVARVDQQTHWRDGRDEEVRVVEAALHGVPPADGRVPREGGPPLRPGRAGDPAPPDPRSRTR